MKYRTIFISDTHLGLPAARADLLLDFLTKNDAQTIYLVGDIIDFWALKRKVFWPAIYNRILRLLQTKMMNGTRIVFLPGNHDDFFRMATGRIFGIEVADTAIHTTAKGRKLLVMHGDQLDYVASHIHWLALLGDWAYDKAIDFSAWLTKIRTKMGLPHWSFSQWAKAQIKGAVTFLEGYEALLKHEAKQWGCEGVVCGHIHTAAIKDDNGFVYINCGDWVESFTAIVEHMDGKLEIVRWNDR